MSVPNMNYPNPALRDFWTLPGAMVNFFGLTLPQVLYEWKKMNEKDIVDLRKMLLEEGYNIVSGTGGLPPKPTGPAALLLLPNNPSRQEKADSDGVIYDDPLSVVPDIHNPGYTVGEEHPAVAATQH